jgi:hypothetical protein
VFFVDDDYRAPGELIEGESSSTIRRRLNDGGHSSGELAVTGEISPLRG